MDIKFRKLMILLPLIKKQARDIEQREKGIEICLKAKFYLHNNVANLYVINLIYKNAICNHQELNIIKSLPLCPT